MSPANVRGLARRVGAVIRSAESHDELGREVLELLLDVLGAPMGNWCSLDPITLLPTGLILSSKASPLISETPALFFERDCDREAPLSVAQVAKAPGGILAASRTPSGDGAFARLKAAVRRTVIGDELRLALTDHEHTWGVISLVRHDTIFEQHELDALAPLGPQLGRALRLSFLTRASRRPDSNGDAPGIIMLDDEGGVANMSAAADGLLPLDDDRTRYWLPHVPALLLAGEQPSLHVITEAGPTTLYATLVGGRPAIIVERTRPLVLAEALVAAYALSAREREVLQGVCSGLSTREIAFSLDIADWTVQDHLKSIFQKTGVSSRKKLVARLLHTHALPLFRQHAEPSPYGWFFEKGS